LLLLFDWNFVIEHETSSLPILMKWAHLASLFGAEPLLFANWLKRTHLFGSPSRGEDASNLGLWILSFLRGVEVTIGPKQWLDYSMMGIRSTKVTRKKHGGQLFQFHSPGTLRKHETSSALFFVGCSSRSTWEDYLFANWSYLARSGSPIRYSIQLARGLFNA